MYGESPEHPHGEDIFYYLTVYNEPYQQPAMPVDSADARAALEQAILRGLYRYAPAAGEPDGERPRAQILASGVAVRWALGAQRLPAAVWGVARSGARRRTCGRRRPGRSCAATRSPARSGTCSTPTRRPACPT